MPLDCLSRAPQHAVLLPPRASFRQPHLRACRAPSRPSSRSSPHRASASAADAWHDASPSAPSSSEAAPASAAPSTVPGRAPPIQKLLPRRMSTCLVEPMRQEAAKTGKNTHLRKKNTAEPPRGPRPPGNKPTSADGERHHPRHRLSCGLGAAVLTWRRSPCRPRRRRMEAPQEGPHRRRLQ